MKRAKDITLVTLILISVLLFSRVWFGTNFIGEIKKNIMFAKAAYESETKSFTIESIITPENIIVTGGGKRRVVSKGQNGYDELFERMKSAAEKIGLNPDRFAEAESDDWSASLKSRSILFDFAAAYDSGLLEKAGISLPDGAYKNIVFVPSDSIAVNSMVYIKNHGNGKVYKFIADSGNDELDAVINKYAVSADAMNSPFSFELGFDKARTNTGISQNVLLDSNIVIGLTEKNVNNAVLHTGSGYFTQRTVDRLLETFKFNPNTTRRYIDKDDVTVFVDNTATLKIYPSYLIEYTSESGGYSFPASGLSGKETAAAYVNGIYGTVREVFKNVGISGMQMLAASDINSETAKSDITINFDYYINGMPVFANGENGAEHGITAVLSGGTLKSYRQYLFTAELAEESENIGSMINALDTLYAKFKNEKEVRLSDVFTAYEADKGSDLLRPVWCAKTEKEIIIISD